MKNRSESTLIKILKNWYVYLLAIIWLYPFYLLVASTFKNSTNIFDFASLPNFTYLDNYIAVFTGTNILRPFLITLTLTVISMAIIVIIGSMSGYALGRAKGKTFRYIYLLFAAALIIPAQSSMITIYKMGVKMHLLGTLPFMIMLYVAGISTYATLIYAGFTKSIPKELEEAAEIDGCNAVRTFVSIIFPLLKPATGTLLATTTYWIWNDFQGPIIYLSAERNKTLVMMVFRFFNATTKATDWGPTFTAALIVSVPMFVFFMFTQKYLLEGLTAGAVKG